MDWFKKHTDTVIVLGGILSSVFWMNMKLSDIDKRLTIIETVLLCKGIMPSMMTTNEGIK